MAYYERLSALDASFLDIEDGRSHMHVAAVLLFDAKPLERDDGGLDVERIRNYVAGRLHLIPRYRQRLVRVPIEQHPVWIDDDRFNIFYHIRHTALPRPGEIRQLKRLCGRILSQQLDVTKPLWEIWVVEGVEGGRFALIAKAHHCMVDGVSGIDILGILLSPDPGVAQGESPPWAPRPAPSSAQLLFDEVWRKVSAPLEFGRASLRALTDVRGALGTVVEGAQGIFEALRGAGTSSSPTPLNPGHIGPHRRFDWLRLEMDAIKYVKKQLGGTLNDVVLATTAGGVRRFLDRRGVSVRGIDFRALVPVSLRRAEEHGLLGNRVAQLIASLPVAEPDPVRRLRKVVATTSALKRSHQSMGGELLEEFSNWAGTTLLSQAFRLATRRRAFNIVVTNIPGPPMPLYMLGAPLEGPWPMVPLFTNQAVGIALFSYAGGLHWGVSADWDEVPDLHDLIEDLEASFAEVREAAEHRHVVPIEIENRHPFAQPG